MGGPIYRNLRYYDPYNYMSDIYYGPIFIHTALTVLEKCKLVISSPEMYFLAFSQLVLYIFASNVAPSRI